MNLASHIFASPSRRVQRCVVYFLAALLFVFAAEGVRSQSREKQSLVKKTKVQSVNKKLKMKAGIAAFREKADVLFNDSNFSNAHWGVMIKSMKTGETLYERNAGKMFMPASNMKLFTTSAALVSLSPEFRYTTTLLRDSMLTGNILVGNLYVRGSGDPTISGRYNGGKILELFELWADSIRSHGINEIRGDIIGDDNCFDEEFYGDGWDAGYATDWYAAQISGISFNDNCVDVTITPSDSISKKGEITWAPYTRYVTIVNETKTVKKEHRSRIVFFREPASNIIHVRGTVAHGKSPWEESVTVENPTLFFLTVFKEVLESRGILVVGDPVDIDTYSRPVEYGQTVKIASAASIPLSEIVKTINKPSQNFYSEQLFRTMGAESLKVGSMETGRSTAFPVFGRWGIDTSSLRIVDGSGLSRLNLVRPADLMGLLSGMYQNEYFSYFYESLPIAGVDGSLKNRMKGTKAENNVHAKTGFIGHVRSLSGYVRSADNEDLAFVMMANNYTVPTSFAEKIQNEICVILAGLKVK